MVTMMEVVVNGGGGPVEEFGGCGQGEINGRRWDAHQWHVVFAYIYLRPLLN